MLTVEQHDQLRHINEAQDQQLRIRALHWVVGNFRPDNDIQFGALVAALGNVTGQHDADEQELRSFVAACEALADCYDKEDEPWPTDPSEACTEAAELAGNNVKWTWAGKGKFAPMAEDGLWRIVTVGLEAIGDGKPIQRCEYCDRPIVAVRSTAKFCNPSCKSGNQARERRANG